MSSASSSSSALHSLWVDHYNTPDSWLPLILPSLLWTSCWCYARLCKKWDFARWYSLHTFHHVGAIAVGSCSLYFNDDAVMRERIGILWSLPYFVVDIVDCVYTGHVLYIAHGLSCAILGLCNYNVPLLTLLRMNSRATFIEASSVLLYQVKQNRKPWLFFLFAVVYTACRIVWIPLMGKLLLENGMEPTHPIFLLLVAFYMLQIHWWIKIVAILIRGPDVGDGGGGGSDAKKEDEQKYEDESSSSLPAGASTATSTSKKEV
jgi:hypothetical protein